MNNDREIKFRAWDGHSFQEDFHINPDGLPVLHRYCIYGAPGDPAPQYKLMQYTGLKDKNGVEIYDGDIVCAKCSKGVMDQIAAVVQESACEWSWGEYGTIYLALIYHEDTEVIGNIHQNPDLLENDDE